MKTILLCLLTSFLIFSGANSQSNWEIINEGAGFSIREIDFINTSTAWALGIKGIWKTNDGGNTWLLILEGERFEFQEIDFINDLTGWALKGSWDIDSLQIHKTLDGGQTWVHQKSVNYGESIVDNNIYAVNDSIVYVLAESLLKTIDGGASWMDVTPPESSDFRMGSFLNADTGIVISRDENDVNSLFRTFNGGDDWDESTFPEISEICDINFLNDSLGYFRARDKTNDRNYRLYKTTDSFNSWVAITDEKTSISGIHFFDKDLAIAVIGDDSVNNLMKSEDGGLSWDDTGDLMLPTGGWTYQFNFFENVGYLSCYGSAGGSFSLKTYNQGTSWSVLNINYPFKDVFFINEERGFFAGGASVGHGSFRDLIRTDDGFKTFDFLLGFQGGNSMLSYCHFISDSVGFYILDGAIMKTSDGGERWIEDAAFRFNDIVDICSINDSAVYAIGNEVYKTSNGGESWDTFYTGGDESVELNSFFFIDENTGWVVGWSGEVFDNPNSGGRPKILKYDNEQGWRELPVKIPHLPLNKIYFADHDNGWILGGYSNRWEEYPLLLKTEDGGENWSEVKEIDHFIRDIYFESKYHGWLVGADSIGKGVILETFDGGLNWEVVKDSLSGSLHALHMRNGVGWAVGDNGLILKTKYVFPFSVNRFMVVGDAHHYSPSPDFSQSILNELTHAAIRENVDFVFFTGDLGMKSFTSPEEEEAVLKDWHLVLNTLYQHGIRVYACRGNVDAGSRETWDALFSDRYAFPQNGPETEKNLTYAIEHDNLLFLSLDQYTDAHKINQEWLDSILTTTSREHIFAAGHEPAFKLRNSSYMGVYPEERNLFWESLTKAGAKAYFSGHDHFFDHAVIDDGDNNSDNDINQVITGTGGGPIFSDSEYNGDNGQWTPVRISHAGAHGYVLVEINDTEAEMTWKQRISPNTFLKVGDKYTFSARTTRLQETDQSDDDLINYPNPFHSSTLITYQLPAASKVKLSIYDLSGRKVAALVNGTQPATQHEVGWNAEGMEPGIYICELKTGQGRQVRKMILIE